MKQGNKTKSPKTMETKENRRKHLTYREENCPLLEQNLVCLEA